MSDYCKWGKYCDTLSNSIIKVYKSDQLVWVGCPDCYDIKRKKELEKNATKQK